MIGRRRMTRRRVLTGGAAMAAAVVGGRYLLGKGGGAPGVVEAFSPSLVSSRETDSSYPSGLAWLSGLNPDGDAQSSTSNVETWATWRGRGVDVINVKGNRNGTWDQMVSSITGKGDVYDAYFQAGYRIEQVVPLLPKMGGDTLVTVNNGAGDSYHTQIANWLTSRSRQTPFVIRLGHELDDTDNIYSPGNDPDQTNYSNYIGAFRRIADIYHNALGGPPDFYIDQNHLRNPQFDPEKVFPGTSYADIVGADIYYNKSAVSVQSDADFDVFSNLTTSQGWPAGPGAWASFARSIGVKFGIGEWGVTNPDGPGSLHDNKYFIHGMYHLCTLNTDILIYESYFNVLDTSSGDHRLLLADGTIDPNNPTAAGQYQTNWTP